MRNRKNVLRLATTLAMFAIAVTQAGCYAEIRTSFRRVAYAKLALNEIGRAIESFRQDVGRYPTTSQGLSVLVQNDSKISGWNGPYLLSVPIDPWGNQYIYEFSERHATYELRCQGEDGAPGGEGAASDLTVGPDSYKRILDPSP
jgi:general secretion pathway protein G